MASPGRPGGGGRYPPPGQRVASVATPPSSRVVHTAAAWKAAGERPPSTAPGGASRNARSLGESAAKRAPVDMVTAQCPPGRAWAKLPHGGGAGRKHAADATAPVETPRDGRE